MQKGFQNLQYHLKIIVFLFRKIFEYMEKIYHSQSDMGNGIEWNGWIPLQSF